MVIFPFGKEQTRSQEGSLRHRAICLTSQDVFDIHLLGLPPNERRCDRRCAGLFGAVEEMSMIRVKRVYDAPDSGDGERILVGVMWPRSLSKKRAPVDLWLKDLTPSDELRRRFEHNSARWAEFKRQYHRELETSPRAVDAIKAYTRGDVVRLLSASRDADHNKALALRDYLDEELKRGVAPNHERSISPFDGSRGSDAVERQE